MRNWLLIGLVTIAGVVAAPAPAAAQAPAKLPEVAFLCSRFCFGPQQNLETERFGQAFLSALRADEIIE